MTDNEIIKALMRCTQEGGGCRNCPHNEECERGDSLMILVLDLINRQKAEIDRSNHIRAELSKIWIDIAKRETGYVELARAEAIKEFAEKLETRLANNTDICAMVHQSIVEQIDNLAKEMIGGLNYEEN